MSAIRYLALTVCSLVLSISVGCGHKELGRQYDKQEFVVVHRPYLSYYIDLVHGLCFARTQKGQGLTEFMCTKSLLLLAKEGTMPFMKHRAAGAENSKKD